MQCVRALKYIIYIKKWTELVNMIGAKAVGGNEATEGTSLRQEILPV